MIHVKGNKLCVPKRTIRELLVRKVHSGGVASHFVMQKTLDTLQDNFYWPSMLTDVNMVISAQLVKDQRALFTKGFMLLYLILIILGIV